MTESEKHELQASLTKVVTAWIYKVCEDDNALNAVGENTPGLMANAAMCVLLASEDVQKYLAENDMMKA